MATNTAVLAGLAIVVGQALINVGAALGKSVFPAVGPEGVAALRTSIAAMILLAVGRPWRFTISWRQWAYLGAYGIAIGWMNLLIYWAFELIPIGVAVAIEISGPLAVVLITSRSARDFIWLALAVVSVLLITPWPGNEAHVDPLGIAFALGAAAWWALYIVVGKYASEVHGPAAVSLGMTVACFVTVPFGVAAAGTKLLATDILIIGIVVALLSSAIPYSLEMKALERLTSRTFGMITSGAPAIAAVVGFLFLGEELDLLQWLAVGTMVIASAGCSWTRRAVPDQRAEEAIISST